MKKVYLLLKVTCAFLFACVISLNLFVDKAMATGQFSQTCENIELNGSNLSADCRKINGSYQGTSIDLDYEIGNLNGVLSWGDHNFSITCKDMGLGQLFTRQYVLNAKCEKADGFTYEQTEITLDEHIANIDGNLKYEGLDD